jgi:D-alanyl-D-alanine carboxypeptidase
MTKAPRFRTLLAGVKAALVFSLVLVMAPATALAAAPEPAPAGNSRLQGLLDEMVANGASGALARVDDGRHTWRLASGSARLEPRQPLTPAARYRVGSVTKTFVSTVTLQLVGEGRLRLDDTVERWLPGLVPNGEAITLRMLLNHTSGLFDYTEDPAFIERLINDPTNPASPRQLIAIARMHPPNFPPGEGWSYSNTGYIVVGLILEAATSQPVERLVRQRIIGPLGLTGITFPTRSPSISGYHAHGYRQPTAPGAPYLDVTPFSPTLAWTAGAIISTADDLRRFYGALLRGRLLRPALLEQMLTTVPVQPEFGYGLGIYTQQTACGTVWGHDGGIPGYLNVAFNDRSGRRSAEVMLHTEPNTDALWSALQLTLDAAVCQMFGLAPPSEAPAARSGSTLLDRTVARQE